MYKVYQVKKGDTIEKIASDLGMDISDLINLNGLNSEIVEGQLIVIPNQDNIFTSYTIVNGDTFFMGNSEYV